MRLGLYQKQDICCWFFIQYEIGMQQQRHRFRSSVLLLILINQYFLLTGKRCDQPLGMQNGRITRKQIMASSFWDKNHGPLNGRLKFRRRGHRMGAWSAKYNNYNQWLMVGFGRATRITIIATQGRQDARQWVTKYYLSYSQDKSTFAEYKVSSTRKVSLSKFVCSFCFRMKKVALKGTVTEQAQI